MQSEDWQNNVDTKPMMCASTYFHIEAEQKVHICAIDDKNANLNQLCWTPYTVAVQLQDGVKQ